MNRRATFSTLTLVTLVGFSSVATARIIDSFSVGPQSFSPSDNAPLTNTRTGLDPSVVIGGERETMFRSVSDNSGSTAIVDTNNEELRLTANQFAYLQLKYGASAPLNADLTADGADRFEIVFSSFSLQLFRGTYDLILVSNGAINRQSFVDELFALNGGGTVEIPFSAFSNIDFTDVDEIQIDMSRIEIGLTMTIDIIHTTPEPNSLLAMLLAIGPLRRR